MKGVALEKRQFMRVGKKNTGGVKLEGEEGVWERLGGVVSGRFLERVGERDVDKGCEERREAHIANGNFWLGINRRRKQKRKKTKKKRRVARKGEKCWSP